MTTDIVTTEKSFKVRVIENNIVVSSLLVRFNPTRKWMKVSRVRTKKEFRKKGYATMVMQHLIKTFGKNEMRLNPHPDNTNGLDYEQLRNFYRHFGFCDVEGQKRMVRLP